MQNSFTNKIKFVFFVAIFLSLTAFFTLIFITADKRSYNQKRRVLFLMDPYFEEMVYKSLEKDINNFCADNGLRAERYIINVKEDPKVNFLTAFNSIEKEDTVLLVLSPFASILFLDNSSINMTKLRYRPIILGLGNKSNDSAFDFMYDMDTSFVFKNFTNDFPPYLKKNDTAFIYSSLDSVSRSSHNAFMQNLTEDDEVKIIDTKNMNMDTLYDYIKIYRNIITPGIRGFGISLLGVEKTHNLYMPYYSDYVSKNYYKILPNIVGAMRYSIENYNKKEGCQNLDMKYIIKWMKG